MKHWLVKSEPEVFSVDDLAACPNQTRWWKHVRNYQARNFKRDDMQIGDRVFFTIPIPIFQLLSVSQKSLQSHIRIRMPLIQLPNTLIPRAILRIHAGSW